MCVWTFAGIDNAHDEIVNENTIQQYKFVLKVQMERERMDERMRRRECGEGEREKNSS